MKNKLQLNFQKCLDFFEAFLFVLVLVVVMLIHPKDTYAQNVAPTAIPHAHSHNDYLKKRPLWGALSNACASIEIDVFAHKNELKVAHVGVALNKRKNINELYLNPLIEYLQQHDWIYPNTPLVLMIDFKDSGKECLPLLMEAISENHKYFTSIHNGQIIEAPLQLVISGHGFDYAQVSALDTAYVFVDGWVDKCTTNFPQVFIERASTRYGSIFSWKGKKSMPLDEEERLRDLVQHSVNCQTPLRFYAMPAKPKVWEKFLDAGVYWINIDNSKKFASFYKQYVKEKGLPIAQKTFNQK